VARSLQANLGIAAHLTIGTGFIAFGLSKLLEGRTELRGSLGDVGTRSTRGDRLPAPMRGGGGTAGAPVAGRVNVKNIDERVKLIVERIKHGGTHPDIHMRAVKALARKVRRGGRVVWAVPENDWRGENVVLFNEVRSPSGQLALRYTRDMLYADTFRHPRVSVQLGGGDCLPAGTLLLTPSGFVPIELVKPGDTIMGDGAWTRVTQWWDKGLLPLMAISLGTGGTLLCTEEHRLLVIPMHGATSGRRDEAFELTAQEVEEGAHLLTPERLPFGRERLGVDRAWLLGVFAADGWIDRPQGQDSDRGIRACISGKDGHPKEAQKRRVEEICTRLGYKTSWHERYIRILDRDAAHWLSACGHLAPNKRIPTLDLDEESTRAVLEGLQADSCVSANGTRVYGTTSPTLAMQIRVLHRMIGEGTSIVRVDDHGGLGTNPIYRVTVRKPVQANGRRGRAYATVRDARDFGLDLPVYDIETESHRFYLPEHDVVVHNCDDSVILLGAALLSVGHSVRVRVVQTEGNKSWNHVYLMARSDHQNPDAWMALDTTVPRPPGWQVPGADETARTGRPTGKVLKIKDYKV